MELRGEWVVLRTMAEDDRPDVIRIHRTPEVAEFWGDEAFEVETGSDEEPIHQFVILADGRIAGFIQGYELLEPQYTYAGMDLFLDPAVHGRGLGTDALRTLARWLIHERGHHRLVIDPRADNARAIAVYTKLGFRPVGILRQYDRGRDGILRDGLLMDLLADELTAPQTDGG